MPAKVDVSEFEAAVGRKGPLCKFALMDLSPAQREKLDEAIFRRPDITDVAVSRVLKSWEVDVSTETISRHRRGECLCGKNGKP